MPEFTVSEIAKRLDRSWLTVYNWLRGTAELTPLPYRLIHYGSKAVRYKIDEDELLDWLGENKPPLKEVWVSKRDEQHHGHHQ